MRVLILVFLLLMILVSGCTQKAETGKNETTEYEYYNVSGNQTLAVPKGDFTFKIYGENEMWIPINKSMKFYAVFNNVDDDRKKHEFIARVHPSAADFDVMAAYKCLHFVTCETLKNDMLSMVKQRETPIEVNYTFVGLYMVEIEVPENAVKGTYMYNMVACEDMPFQNCTEEEANWGPNIPVIIHVF